jgi:transposase-like protein
MVKLSALKGLRGQYRLRVRYRLLVLEYATLHGPTAAARRYGVCPRTVCRWRRRWRAEGLAGLTPRYPRQRPSRLRPEVLGHIHQRDVALQGRPDAAGLLRVHQVGSPWARSNVFRRPAPYLRRTRSRAAAAEAFRRSRRVGAGG